MTETKTKVKDASKAIWISTDAWRGYLVPPYAVAGVSYTGNFEDSPAPLDKIKPEIDKLRAYLKEKGINTKLVYTITSNLFWIKIWVIAEPEDYEKAKELADKWLVDNEHQTIYIHDADREGKELKENELEPGDITEISDKEWEGEAESNKERVEEVPQAEKQAIPIQNIMVKRAQLKTPLLQKNQVIPINEGILKFTPPKNFKHSQKHNIRLKA